MKLQLLLLSLLLVLFTGCGDSSSDSAFSQTSPKSIEENQVYSLYMYADTDESYNKSYLAFRPKSTGYYSLHIGTKESQDLDIYLYSDEDFTQLLTSAETTSLYGEQLTYNLKADQTYYMIVSNYDNTIDIDYSLLATTSTVNGFHTKENPISFTLSDYDEFEVLSQIGYDSPLSIFDTNEDKHYIHIFSTKNTTLYMKTFTTQNNQDLDIKVYSDAKYSNLMYESSSTSLSIESLQINFENSKDYYIEITNFTNDAEAEFILSMDRDDFVF